MSFSVRDDGRGALRGERPRGREHLHGDATLGLLRNTFGWKLVVPADPNQTDRATRWMLGTPGCICLAMGRSKVDAVVDAHGDPVFARDYRFEYGRAVRVRQGGMGTIFALGSMTQKALVAAGLLAGRGIDVSVWSVSCPLEVDRAALEEACASGYVSSRSKSVV